MTISENFRRFQWINFETGFLETKTFFKKLEYGFLVESTKIENASFPAKIGIWEANVNTHKMVTTKWTFTKNGVSAVTTTVIIFWKFCFSLKTCYTELICCTNNPNAHICTFCKRWTFIWRCFFPVSILKEINIMKFFNVGLIFTPEVLILYKKVWGPRRVGVVNFYISCQDFWAKNKKSNTKKILNKWVSKYMSCLCIFRSWKKGVKETKISEVLVQRLSTEPKLTAMKYSRKEPRDFIPFKHGEEQFISSKRHSRTIWKNIETVTSWLQNKVLHDPG